MPDFFFDRVSNVILYPGVPIPALKAAGLTLHEFGDKAFAVPRRLRECQLLAHYNYPVPPIMEGYNWPAFPGIKPYESQILSANFMILRPRCFVLSDMGSGKTLSALWAADWLMRTQPKPFKALVIAPLSILHTKWAVDIGRTFSGKRKVRILHGDAQKRIRELDEDADFYLVNYDGIGVGAHTRKKFELDGFSAALAARDDIKLVIADEASAYKDATTKRHKIARIVIGQKPYLWLMTGTPTPTSPTDAYGLAKLVNNAFGKSYRTFEMETMYKLPHSQFKMIPQKDGYEKAGRLLSPSIRVDIRDVWDAPPLIMHQREVSLTDEQKKAMADLKRDLQFVVASGKEIAPLNEAAARLKYLQISTGAVYDGDHKTHVMDAKPRLAELKEVLTQAPGKVLLFAMFTSVVEMLHRELKKLWPCAIINGNTHPKERAKVFTAFQETDDLRIIIADPGTMSHGLDLYQAQTVIWYSPVDKAEVFDQANHRAHRPGQKHPVNVIQLVSNKLEVEIFKRLENNLSLQGALLSMVQKGEI